MFIKLEPDEELKIKVGERVWLFEANAPDEAWLHAESTGDKIYATVAVTRSMSGGYSSASEEGDGARLNVVADP